MRRAGIVAEAVSQPQQILRSLGEPKLAGIQSVYCSESLMFLNVLWGPGMSLYPHDHRMWALIGTHSGREDNFLYRKSESGFVLQGGKMLGLKEAIPLGEAVIRSVPTRLIRSQRRSASMAAISSPCREANGTRAHPGTALRH